LTLYVAPDILEYEKSYVSYLKSLDDIYTVFDYELILASEKVNTIFEKQNLPVISPIFVLKKEGGNGTNGKNGADSTSKKGLKKDISLDLLFTAL
jgi:hypothetical protein